MNRALAMLIIGLVFGGGLGFVLAAANNATLDGHDHATDHGGGGIESHEAGSHDHGETVSLAPGPNAPTLAARLIADPVSGWNLELVTTGFTFAPEHSGGAHVAGEGHAHLYVNGTKTARLYGPWAHIASLPEGEVEITVTLNTNDHRTLTIGDTPLAATMTLGN